MILERVEIVGFRGINRLSLMLEQNNVLIGENAWGKSSLLDALTLLLSPESDLYHFERDDFWYPPGDINGREHHLHIILTFRESLPGRHRFAVIGAGSVLDAMHRWLSPYYFIVWKGRVRKTAA